jgi:Bacterial PH domain
MFPLGPMSRFSTSYLEDWFDSRLDRIVGPTQESVIFVHRRHWLVLVVPGLTALLASAFILGSAEPLIWLAVYAGVVTWLAKRRNSWSSRKTWFVVALWVVPMLLALDSPSWFVRSVAVLGFLGHLVMVLLQWWLERLVLTDTALWKLSGVISTASPKAPLTSIQFQDVQQNALEQVLHCGTLNFDTAAQSDKPLSRFGPVTEPFEVGALIHQQRLHATRPPPPRAAPSSPSE